MTKLPFTPEDMNGANVERSETTIFVPLPRALWKPAGKCQCAYCGGGESFWDTLAVAVTPEKKRTDTAWTVHAPEYHGAQPKKI